MTTQKFTGDDLRRARENAGHSQSKAAVMMDISTNKVIDFELRNDLPKNVHLQNAIFAYIKKHVG